MQQVRKKYLTKDFKVLAMTWNMGQKNQTAFKDTPELFFKNVNEFDLIAVCVQECKKKYKHERLEELAQYLSGKGFQNVDKTFISMWEMWLVCFVKDKYKRDVTKIRSA